MTPSHTIFTALVVITYTILTSWLTLRLRSKTSSQFMLAERALPAAIIGVVLMSEFVGANSTIGTAQEAFRSGFGAAWSVFGASIGFCLFGLFFVSRLYRSGEYTISAAIAHYYGKRTMRAVSLLMICALLMVNVGNYLSGAAAIAPALGISLPAAIYLIALVSTFFYFFGGLKGVAYVTLIHTGIKLTGLALILTLALRLTHGIRPIVQTLPPAFLTWNGLIHPSTIVAWTIGTCAALFSTQYVVQAISSTPSAEDAKRSAFYAALLCLPLGFGLAAIGLAARTLYPGMNSLFALPVFISHMGPVSAALVTTGLVASVFVSVSTVGLAVVSLVIRDFYLPRFGPSREFVATRIASLLVAVLPLLFVFFVPSILKLSFFSRGLRLTITLVGLLGFYCPQLRNDRAAMFSLILSAVATTLWYLNDNPLGIDNIYIAIVTPVLVLAATRLIQMAMGRGPEKHNLDIRQVEIKKS